MDIKNVKVNDIVLLLEADDVDINHVRSHCSKEKIVGIVKSLSPDMYLNYAGIDFVESGFKAGHSLENILPGGKSGYWIRAEYLAPYKRSLKERPTWNTKM